MQPEGLGLWVGSDGNIQRKACEERWCQESGGDALQEEGRNEWRICQCTGARQGLVSIVPFHETELSQLLVTLTQLCFKNYSEP